MPPALQQLIDRVGGQRRAMMIGVGVVAALAIFGVSRWATAPTWVQPFSGMSLETVGAVTQKLDEEGIPYQLEGGGARLLVQESDVARVRVSLAKQGLPEAGRPGMELFDQPSWGMTDFTQRINYRRALEGELERTIGKMRGIEAAQVHLAMSESSLRSANRPAQASVVLKLRDGSTPPAEVVQGIAHLVASSVDALQSENVSVLDEAGRLLSVPNDPGSVTSLTNRQLSVQREIEAHLESKAVQLLAQMVGGGNARVQVAAAVNFDRVERTVEQLDPDRQVIASEQKAEIVPGPQGGAGSTNTAATYENSRSVESFSGATGTVKRLTVAVLVNDHLPGADGTAAAPRTPQELQRIEALVRSAVGIDDARGDVVSVVSVPFDGGALSAAPEPMNVWEVVQVAQRPGIAVLGLLLAFVLGLKVIRALRPEMAMGELALAGAAAGGGVMALPGMADEGEEAEDEGTDEGMDNYLIPPPPPQKTLPALYLKADNPLRDQVVSSVEERPDVAARLVRAWLKEP